MPMLTEKQTEPYSNTSVDLNVTTEQTNIIRGPRCVLVLYFHNMGEIEL